MRYGGGEYSCNSGCGGPSRISGRHRGYYSPPPGYGCNNYGYGNPPAIVDRPVLVVADDSDSDQEFDTYYDYI